MKHVKIKICGITEKEIALLCAEQKVDFLGLHQIKYPLTEEKKALFSKIKEKVPQIKLVLVTQEVDQDNLLEMCLACDWDYIQLHFDIKAGDIAKLRSNLIKNSSKAGIISVVALNDLEKYDIAELSKFSDFLLFDSSIHGGTGTLSSEEVLKKASVSAKGTDFFIAGGLNVDNVAKVIKICHPYGVDVQSGVEFPNIKYKKDPERIRSFVGAVRSCYK